MSSARQPIALKICATILPPMVLVIAALKTALYFKIWWTDGTDRVLAQMSSDVPALLASVALLLAVSFLLYLVLKYRKGGRSSGEADDHPDRSS